MTSSRQTQVQLVPVRRRILEVLRTHDLTPAFRRIVLTGADLETDFPFVGFAPTDHVKLFFPQPESGEIVIPEITPDGWSLPPGSPAPIYRDYTVRAFDRETLSLDIDFVLHDHGIAGSWAATAEPGMRLGALGPRGSFRVKDVFDWYLLAVDETALPAAARWLESLRPQARAFVYVEVDGPEAELPLFSPAGLEVTWLHRGGRPAGSTDLIEQAVRGFDRPEGSGFTWVAGETLSIKPLRGFLKNELGLDRDDYDVDGYWRRGEVNHDHHEDEDDGEG